MSKKKIEIGENSISGNAGDILELMGEALKKELEIKSAHLDGDFCNYSYELKTGVCTGDCLSRDGASIVHDDLKEKFKRLNVHIAYLDDSYTLANHEIADIDQYHEDDIATKYETIGFKLDGTGENESIVLSGNKSVWFGSIKIKTPKITFDGSYRFINELRLAVDECIIEVEAYMNGKTAQKLIQTEMDFQHEEDN